MKIQLRISFTSPEIEIKVVGTKKHQYSSTFVPKLFHYLPPPFSTFVKGRHPIAGRGTWLLYYKLLTQFSLLSSCTLCAAKKWPNFAPMDSSFSPLLCQLNSYDVLQSCHIDLFTIQPHYYIIHQSPGWFGPSSRSIPLDHEPL